MYHAETFKGKVTLFFKILWPIIVTQISLAMMNLVDTIMAGQVGTEDLAGVAIGASLWSPVFTGTNGIMLAVTPIIAHYLGQEQKDRIHFTVTQAIYLATAIAMIIIIVGCIALSPILTFMELEPNVEHIALHYLIGLSTGIIPLFISNVLRNFYDAQGLTRISMLITVLAVPFNVFLNYCLIFGKFGLPALGGIGAGYATGLTYWIILLMNVITTLKVQSIKHYKIFAHWVKPSLEAWKEQLAIGIPIGLTVFFESSIFSVVTLLIGFMFSTTMIAANQIVISFSSLIFMIPLSLSMALTIVVGYSVGGNRLKEAKHYSFLGVFIGIGILSITATLMFFFRENIARLYSNDLEAIQLAAQLFLVAILYQFSDATQAGLQGVLRGYKDVKIPFFIAFTSYWILGIPTGYLLATLTDLGPFGLWIGISIGLTSAAIGFLLRLRFIYKKEKQKVQARTV
ncbi:MATE family efflux transporter [Amphibacillus sp. MSJ-3]|uniref:MATE family efflux transporter n=1 Tax=Amphibacillus sp. MSJ-3 TaxID=2841505 RepID=UPI001C0F0EC3|nr:MATE family efflux transporter [Amphibacillus sp. MSJ-3]MBU5594460.1 MATE family efflux transporter [Amphibacillus sp. MSJ-3]